MVVSERMELEAAIAVLEGQRSVLGDGVVDAALGPMRDKLAALDAADSARGDDGERRIVTVIFADLSGSTALGEVMDPEEIRALLNNCFDRLVPVVKHFGGTVDKFQGDNIMALFGAPVAHENDPERALRACLGMMEALEEFNTDMGVDLGFHIGVNTGLVIAGGLGSKGDQSYSVMGDTVNVAARLEAAAVRGEIIVGPDTHRLAEPFFEFEDREAISVKGRDEPVKIYQLLSVKTGHHSTRGIAGLASPMIGRDTELDGLLSGLAALAEGQGGIVGIVAEAGVGKSRFVAEAQAVSSEGIEWVVGAALAYSTDTPYALAADLMRDMLGVAADTSLDEVSGVLAGRLALGMSADEAEAEWPFLARLLDLPLAEKGTAVLDQYAGSPEVLVQRTEDAFTRLVTAVAAGPLVLVWEDLHWADTSSLGLLDRLIGLTSDLPLLLVLMFRPGDSTISDLYQQLTDDQTPGLETIELSPLSRDDSTLLVDGLLKIENLPEPTRDLILDRAQGNPLFLEELLRSLIDAGMVVVEAGKATAADSIHDLEAIDIPDTIHGVIGARIDRLPASRKTTLESSSVIGRVFQHQVLGRVTTGAIDEDLGELERLEFITAENAMAQSTEYLFKHVFTQEAAYNGILFSRRRTLHAAAAEAIEALFPERLDKLSATLARHYENADRPDQAVPYFLIAAQRAADAYATDDALTLATRGLELTSPEDLRTQTDFLLIRDSVYAVRSGSDLESQKSNLDALESAAAGFEDEALTLDVGFRKARFDFWAGHHDQIIERVGSLLEAAVAFGDHRKRAHLLVVSGHARMAAGDATGAAGDYELALDIARRHALLDIEMFAVSAVGSQRQRIGDREGAERASARTLEIATQLGDKSRQGIALHNLAWHALNTARFDEARTHLDIGIELATAESNTVSVLGQSAVLADLLYLTGDYEAALAKANEALAISREFGSRVSHVWTPLLLREIGDYLLALGRVDEAREALNESLRMRRDAEDPAEMHSRAAIVRLLLAERDAPGAAEMASPIIDFVLDGGDLTTIEYAARVYAACLQAIDTIADPRIDSLRAFARERLEIDERAGQAKLPWHDELRAILGNE